jgi:hypothetical protein
MLKLTVMIIIGLLILSFFGISLRTLVLSPTAQDNFKFAGTLLGQGWNWLVAWINSTGASLNHMMTFGHPTPAAVIKARRP